MGLKRIILSLAGGLLSVSSSLAQVSDERSTKPEKNIFVTEIKDSKEQKTVYDIPYLKIEIRKAKFLKSDPFSLESIIEDSIFLDWPVNEDKFTHMNVYLSGHGIDSFFQSRDGKKLYCRMMTKLYKKKDFRRILSYLGEIDSMGIKNGRKMYDYDTHNFVVVEGEGNVIPKKEYDFLFKKARYENKEEIERFKNLREEFYKGVVSSDSVAKILLDPTNSTKAIFRIGIGTSPRELGNLSELALSPNGKILYLGFENLVNYSKELEERLARTEHGYRLKNLAGIYLVDWESKKILYSNFETSYAYLYGFSESGDIFFAGNTFIDVYNRKVMRVTNPHSICSRLQRYGLLMSPNGKYVIRQVGMFSSNHTVEGQFGMEIYSLENGTYFFASPEYSFYLGKISDDGTVIDGRGQVFKFMDGMYKYMGPSEPNGSYLSHLKNLEVLRNE